jgi:hypothetical protein
MYGGTTAPADSKRPDGPTLSGRIRFYLFNLGKSEIYVPQITPAHGSANLRIGTRDFKSFFQGAIREVRIWNSSHPKSHLCTIVGLFQEMDL